VVVVRVGSGGGEEASDGPARSDSREAARVLARVDPPLRPPSFDGFVERRALIERWSRSRARVALVLAPAGYGKTTLLSQWAAFDERPVSWVALRESDNDAPSLLAHLLFALESVMPVQRAHFDAIALSGADLTTVVLPRFGTLVADAPETVWMLDDVHVLRSDRARQTMRVLVDHLPQASAVVLAGRRAPALPVARWRAGRTLIDVGTDDLAMSADESHALLESSGVGLSRAAAASIVARTEGWAAGLYLSTLTMRAPLADVRGEESIDASDDRAISEYLLDEVLRSTTDDEAAFLTRSSVLDEMHGENCDAVLEREGSAALLDHFERSNRFVRSIDGNRSSYRYHQLFRDSLAAELERREPGRAAELHHRASAWYEARGDDDRAIHHARAAGDVERVASRIWSAMPVYVGSGRAETVERWLDDSSLAEILASPALLIAAAWLAFAGGRSDSTDQWAAVLAGHDPDERLPDGTTVGAAASLLGAMLSHHGLTRSLADATRAIAGYPATSPYRALASLIAGMAARHLGDLAQARTRFDEAERLSVLFPPTAALVAGQLAALAADAGAWADARERVDDALVVIDRFGFEERPAMSQVYAIAALVRAQHGHEDARVLAERAAWLVPLLRGVARFATLDTRITLARALVVLGAPGEARAHVAEARAMLDTYPDAGLLPDRVADVSVRLDATALPLGASAAPLTPAELRVLRYLPTHLSFGDIAREIFVSRNTVKTQAIAVYRKLGVTSRAAAVARARAAGLLDT
jgi:LuxR family maltose regulon positive regulatory protein